MAARRELVARIAGLAESIATTGQMEPRDFVMEADLTLPQIRVLYTLASGPARITNISQAHGMAAPNASNMVERLVRKGLAERVSDPNDRRVVLARLTYEGRETVEAIKRSDYLAIEKTAAFLSIDELEVIAQAFEIMNRGVERLQAASGGAVAAQPLDR